MTESSVDLKSISDPITDDCIADKMYEATSKSAWDKPPPDVFGTDAASSYELNNYVFNHLPYINNAQKLEFLAKVVSDQRQKEASEESKKWKLTRRRPIIKTAPQAKESIKEITKQEHKSKDEFQKSSSTRGDATGSKAAAT
jgi:hypothetical protein